MFVFRRTMQDGWTSCTTTWRLKYCIVVCIQAHNARRVNQLHNHMEIKILYCCLYSGAQCTTGEPAAQPHEDEEGPGAVAAGRVGGALQEAIPRAAAARTRRLHQVLLGELVTSLRQPCFPLLHGLKQSWCDGSLDRSFMGWTHWAISRSSQCSTTGVAKAVVCVILSVVWCI